MRRNAGIYAPIVELISSKTSLIFAKPKGIINPRHIKFDIETLQQKTNKISRQWTYIVDTSHVKLANPLNLFYLRKIQHLKGFKAFYIIANNPLIRLLNTLFDSLIGISGTYKNSKDLDL